MVASFIEKIRKLKTNLHLMRTIRLIWLVTHGWAALTVVMIVIESALFLISLYIFKLLINAVASPPFTTEKIHLITTYLLEAGITTVLYVTIKAITSHITEIQASKISEHIDDKIHTHAVDLDLAFYESPAYFDTMKRAKDAGPERPNAILTNLVDIAKNGMMLLVLGSVMVSISWVLFPLLALFVLPTLLVRISFANKIYRWRRQQTPVERKSSYLSSLLTGDVAAKEIKAFGLGNYLSTLYLNLRMNLLSQRLKITRKSTINEIITTVLATLGLFTSIAYICISTIKGNTSVGDISLFLIIFPQLFNLMQALSNGISALYQNNIFVSNLFELFDLKSTLAEPVVALPVPSADKMNLDLEGVSFTYPHAKEKTLSDITLQIPTGKIIAIVGLNGAGKTTLIKLLCRLYDPSAGHIKMGGTDIRNFKSKAFRKAVSVVFQDFGRYNVSVSDNIRFGDIDSVHLQADIEDAAMKSGAHLFINKFPQRYDTTMGRIFEEGREVSIGQWQKLAIARAFYSKSRFIIFDEATSALDAVAEHDLFQSFRERIGNRGILIISHRLSAVKHADHIYVMAEGKIKQHGTHEELVATSGDYSRMFLKKSATA